MKHPLTILVILIASAAWGQDGAAIYKTKCAVCHGADGTGAPTGKRMGAHDFTTDYVQNMSNAELANVITNGKNGMPMYRSLPPEDVKSLVDFIRTLKK